METKITDEASSRLMHNLGFNSFVTSPPFGLKGGFVLFWRPNISLVVEFISFNVIVVMIFFFVYFIHGPSIWYLRPQF